MGEDNFSVKMSSTVALPPQGDKSLPARSALFLNLDRLGELRAQLRRILVAMHRDGVLGGRVDQFRFAVGGNRNRAFFFARVLTAVDEHPRYDGPPGELDCRQRNIINVGGS
jgi:hypothetical protein